MDFADLLKKRRSTRAFQKKHVPPEILDAILSAMGEAPSAGNMQAYKIIATAGAKTIAALSEAAGQEWISKAPVAAVFFADPPRSAEKFGERGKYLAEYDAIIAGAYFQLCAANAGLSTCWVRKFDEKKLCALLRAPAHLVPVAIFPLGYAAESPARKPRRPLSEILVNEKF